MINEKLVQQVREGKVYKYFIEDVDTGLWYRNTILEEPTVHTYGEGYDKPEVTEYWTNDPHQALSLFKDKEDAELWLAELLDKKYFWFQKADRTMKNLKITEHEFVSNCNCKKGECCDKCAPLICPETKKECVRHPLECNTVCWELQYDQRTGRMSAADNCNEIISDKIENKKNCRWTELRDLWRSITKIPREQQGIIAFEQFLIGYEEGLKDTPTKSMVECNDTIRRLNAVLIHFSTLDKMPTLGLLDRKGVIEHVVNIAKEKLASTPSKGVEEIISYIENDAEIAIPVDMFFDENGCAITKKRYGQILIEILCNELREKFATPNLSPKGVEGLQCNSCHVTELITDNHCNVCGARQ